MFEKTAEEEKKRDGGVSEKKPLSDIMKQSEKSDSDDFYRSQKDVDAAFKKRFASQREKWEKEQEEKRIAEEDEGKVMSLIRQIENQAEEFNRIYPDVDIYEEIEKNPLFAYLVMNGKELTDTYEFLHAEEAKSRIRNELEQEIIGNLKARNTRPRVINSANSGGSSRDIARLSDADILRIDQRIKNGEKVTL